MAANKILFDKETVLSMQVEMKERQRELNLRRSESNTTIGTGFNVTTPKDDHRHMVRNSSMRNSVGVDIDDSFDQRSRMSDKQVSWKEDRVRGGAGQFTRKGGGDDFERSVTSVISESAELGDNFQAEINQQHQHGNGHAHSSQSTVRNVQSAGMRRVGGGNVEVIREVEQEYVQGQQITRNRF